MRARAAIACVIAAAALAAAEAQQEPGRTAVFAIRADPSVAVSIDRLLATVAQPVTAKLPAGQTAEAYLRSICGDRAPAPLPQDGTAPGNAAAPSVRFTPCVRQRTDVTAIAHAGDTREAIAVRLGLRPASAGSLRVAAPGGAARPLRAAVMPGDTVTAPAVPAWTVFAPRPGALRSREELVAALSAAVGCAPAGEAACLTPRGILVLARPDHPPPAATGPAGPASTSTARRDQAQILTPGQLAAAVTLSLRSFHIGDKVATVASADGGSAAPASRGPAPASLPEPTPTGAAPARPAESPSPGPAAAVYPDALSAADLASAGVAPEQWPYDVRQTAAVLEAAASRGPVANVVVGVADNGLATSAGLPLSPASLADTLEQGPPDGVDDDGNDYLDDIVGAGVRRDPDDPMPTGDVGLCANPLDAKALAGAEREAASHGSVVASIASGLPLRVARPAAAGLLPRVMFFRLFRDGCAAVPNDDHDQASIDAIDYLVRAAVDVINLSSFVDGQGGQSLSDRVKTLAAYGTPLLVVPAGNGPIDLDATRPCPPCLAQLRGGPISASVLAVGAATSDLRPAAFSGRGYGTVRLFAPAEPKGAVDIAGSDAGAFEPATSYAAPLASLAAAVLKAQGLTDPNRLRNRLLLSTWPLYEGGAPVGPAGGPIDVGVLDLLKAAALRFDVVEAMERRGGTLVRVTRAGDITSGLDGICAGQKVDGKRLLALRIGATASDGTRTVTMVSRDIDTTTRDPRIAAVPACRPAGPLMLHDVRGADVPLPLAAVTQILFRGRTH